MKDRHALVRVPVAPVVVLPDHLKPAAPEVTARREWLRDAPETVFTRPDGVEVHVVDLRKRRPRKRKSKPEPGWWFRQTQTEERKETEE